MADEAKLGTPWRDDELDAIVADYFDMLAAELAERPYTKAGHNAALRARIERTHRSVEFKHQNISAVLEDLGLPWIPGYKPKKNYQNAIFDAIDRYLSSHPAELQRGATSSPFPTPLTGVLVAKPKLIERENALPRRLQRLVRKFDPVERDFRNRSLGNAGEGFVIDLEKRRLQELERLDLASNVRWIAVEEGDAAGYDILSYSPEGRERLIEVKTTNGSARAPFFLSRNELALSRERPTDWLIDRVHLFATSPRIFTIEPPLNKSVNLTAEIWRAGF